MHLYLLLAWSHNVIYILLRTSRKSLLRTERYLYFWVLRNFLPHLDPLALLDPWRHHSMGCPFFEPAGLLIPWIFFILDRANFCRHWTVLSIITVILMDVDRQFAWVVVLPESRLWLWLQVFINGWITEISIIHICKVFSCSFLFLLLDTEEIWEVQTRFFVVFCSFGSYFGQLLLWLQVVRLQFFVWRDFGQLLLGERLFSLRRLHMP